MHTWGQNLTVRPHVHCIVPAGGLSPDHRRWIHPRYRFFLPVKVLSRIFRGKFVDALRRTHRENRLQSSGAIANLAHPARFKAFVDSLFRQDWVVYAKPAMGGASQVLRYLGRYTHRVAISNHRLLALEGDTVTFRWKDYAHGNKQRKMTVAGPEFLRRLVQHILPRGFVRIRQFGFLANGHRTALIRLARSLLEEAPIPDGAAAMPHAAAWRCPKCGTVMRIGSNLTATQLRSRCATFDSS